MICDIAKQKRLGWSNNWPRIGTSVTGINSNSGKVTGIQPSFVCKQRWAIICDVTLVYVQDVFFFQN